MEKRLTRSLTERKLSGVCGGIAEYFDVDPTLVRVAYLLLTFFSAAFPGIILYIILAILMPEKN
ncbi:MAG: PspC domain-containing protein [Prevotella sp.]|nr:PspC domain-containing protein [Prevotella sp.]